MAAKVRSFEDLRVYQKARQLVKAVYEVTCHAAFRRDFSLTDQMRRAAVSIVSNIAEGYERGSNVEFVRFLCIAKGSCGEVRAQVGVAHDLRYITDEEKEDLINRCREISKMLAAFIEYLKQGRFSGQKYKQPTAAPDSPGLKLET